MQETFETVDDLYVVPASVAMGRLSLSLPEETTMQVMALSDENSLYVCDGYTLVVQTMESGNLEETFRQTTGFSKEELIHKVWGYASSTSDNNVEAYISFLRKKLNLLESRVSIIAIKKQGYKLETST